MSKVKVETEPEGLGESFDAPKIVELKVRLEGISPLVMHNIRLANREDPITKELHEILDRNKGKKEVPDEDKEKIRWLEFYGGGYWNADDEPILPADNLVACLCDGAVAWKRGLQQSIKAAVDVQEDPVLDLKGPKTAKALFEKGAYPKGHVLVRAVRQQRNAIMRVRPIFHIGWSASFTLIVNASIVNVDTVKTSFLYAGQRCGICDWTPRHGRFLAKFHG